MQALRKVAIMSAAFRNGLNFECSLLSDTCLEYQLSRYSTHLKRNAGLSIKKEGINYSTVVLWEKQGIFVDPHFLLMLMDRITA